MYVQHTADMTILLLSDLQFLYAYLSDDLAVFKVMIPYKCH